MRQNLTDALVWLRYAQEDLAAAVALAGDESVVPRHPAWLAQQAAEKAIKAALVAAGRPFPRTHDLDRLVRLLADPSVVLATGADLSDLTEYAVESRYPGDLLDEVLVQDAARAVDDAGKIIAAVGAALGQSEGGGQDG